MALIFVEGFEGKDMPLKWNGASPGFYTTGRFGTGVATGYNGGLATKYLFQELAQAFIGYATLCTNTGASGFGHGLVVLGDNGSTSHLSVRITTTSLTLCAGFYGSVIASYPASFVNNTWYYIEIWTQLATSGGRCQVRLNGNLVIDYTGNTMNGGTNTTVDAFLIGSNNSSVNDYFDDIYVCDATGTKNNTFLGDVRVQTLFPTAAGSSTQLTPTGSANNYANVNDVPDSTSTYNASTTVGNRDTYAMGDVLASTGTIFGVQDNMHGFKTDSGSANMKPALLSGPTLVYDPTLVLTPSNAWTSAVRETDPNTGTSWTPAGINAVEFGGEVA